MKINRFKITIFIIMVLIIMCIVTIVSPGKTYTSDTTEIINSSNTNEFNNKDIIEQTFISKGNYKFVGIQIATYATYIKKGKLVVYIENQKGKQKKYTIKANSIIDNQTYYLKYKLRKNQKYKIIIDGEKLSSPITFLTTQKEMPDYELKINNKKMDSNLILSFIKNRKDYFSIWYYLLAISVLSSYAIMVKESK